MARIPFNWAVVATFAEEGEYKTALELVNESSIKDTDLNLFDKIMAAITFSEDGLHDFAASLLTPKKVNTTFVDFLNEIGLDYRNCFLITIDAN